MLLRQSGSGTGGGGGPTSIAGVCDAGDAVDNLVFVSGPEVGGIVRVSKIDITDKAKGPATGIIQSKATATDCVVHLRGPYPLAGVTAGATIYAGTAGTMIEGGPGRPVSGFRTYQVVGYGRPTGTVDFQPELTVTRLKVAV